MKNRIIRNTCSVVSCIVLFLLGVTTSAATTPANNHEQSFPLEEMLIVATKKSEAEALQETALAITLLSQDTLAERFVTDLEDLSYSLPNVALDGIGTGKGIANFSIRGVGIAGSIPSIDPTVGVFVDGVYLGMNYGVIMDMLDLEAIEVLRGPQGVLFGRNVTGGAILLRSRRPSGESSTHASLRIETGLDSGFTASTEGSFNHEFDYRLSTGYRNDQGWFDNKAPNGGAVGAESTWVVRPVLSWQKADLLDVTFIYEKGDSDGDGPATQNRYRFDEFGFAIDELGFSRVNWQHLIVQADRQVGLGKGLVTNLFGLREVEHDSLADVDSTIDPIFHLHAHTEQWQVSNELRYSGWLRPRWEITTGWYMFKQDILYRERRVIRSQWGVPFGGDQDHRTTGLYLSNDIELNHKWLLTWGARYTIEQKDVNVATAGNSFCSVTSHVCEYDFEDGNSWRNITPKIGLQFMPKPGTLYYGYFTKGFRSGGYNVRNNAPGVAPGPFDEEEQDAFELGVKSQLASGRVSLNIAAFHSRIYGIQRQVTRSDIAAGGVQVTANTADATIKGIELELSAAMTRNMMLSTFASLTDGAYDRVLYDLDRDGSTVGDKDFDLPRLAPLTWGIEGRYTHKLRTLGRILVRISISHRDDSEIAADNQGVLDGGNLVGMNISVAPSERWSISFYGKNLLNEVLRRSHFDLTGLVRSTYSPLKEGRVLGVSVRGKL